MLDLEFKILVLTGIYFICWFIFEKVVGRGWNYFTGAQEDYRENVKERKIPVLASVTPLDQSWRYIKGLQNPDWRIRRISCVQLADKRGSAVVHALISALDDQREEVSMAAGEALAKIGDPIAIKALSEHLNRLEGKIDQSYERYRAA